LPGPNACEVLVSDPRTSVPIQDDGHRRIAAETAYPPQTIKYPTKPLSPSHLSFLLHNWYHSHLPSICCQSWPHLHPAKLLQLWNTSLRTHCTKASEISILAEPLEPVHLGRFYNLTPVQTFQTLLPALASTMLKSSVADATWSRYALYVWEELKTHDLMLCCEVL
jgi:hypothetical protein